MTSGRSLELARGGQRTDAPDCRQGRRRVAVALAGAAGLAAAILAVLMLVPGCSEKESFSPDLLGGLGSDTLYKAIVLPTVEEVTAAAGNSSGNPYASKRLVVCDWRGHRSMCFLRFSELPDTTVEILEATLFLYATRVQSAAQEGRLGIYTLADSLADTTVTWATLPGLDQLVSAFSLSSPDPETIAADSVTVDVTSLVISWVRQERENLGLAVKIEDDSPGEAIVEFASREDPGKRNVVAGEDTADFYVRPAIRIVYADTSSAARAAEALPSGHLAAAQADTSYLQALSTADTFAHTLLAPLPDTLLACANGFPSRTFLRFDLAAIPQEATVIRAQLDLTIDIPASSFDSMAVVCHGLVEPYEGFVTSYGAAGSGSTILSYADKRDDPQIVADITPLVQPWVSRKVTNYGIVVRSTNEKADLDYVVFTSTRGGSTEAPRLEIQYVVPAPTRIGGD